MEKDTNFTDGMAGLLKAAQGQIPPLEGIFGEEKLSYGDFLARAASSGIHIGNLDEAEERHEKELNNVHISYAMERELARFGAKNTDLVKKALNMDEIHVENGKVIGLVEQLTALSASDPYLFREKGGASTGAEHGGSVTDPDQMSDADYYRRIKKI